MPTIISRQQAKRFGGGDVSVTLSATGANRLVVALIEGRSSVADSFVTAAALNTVGGTIVAAANTSATNGSQHTAFGLVVWPEGDHPGAGTFTLNFSMISAEAALTIYEIENADQVAPYAAIDISTFTTTPADPQTVSKTVVGQSGKTGLMFWGAGNSSFWDMTPTTSANLSNGEFTDNTSTMLYSAEDENIASASELHEITVDFTNGTTPPQGIYGSIVIASFAAAGPIVTTITTDPATTGAELTISGTTFEAAQGTGGITQEQGAVVVALTENTWSDTSITADSATIESTQLKYGTQTLRVTADAGGSGTKTFVAEPLADNDYTDLVSIATSGQLLTELGSLAIGDQVRFGTLLLLGGVPTIYTFTVNDDATFSIDGATPDGTYTVPTIAWDTSDQTWGTVGVQTVTIGEAVSDGIMQDIMQDIMQPIMASGY